MRLRTTSEAPRRSLSGTRTYGVQRATAARVLVVEDDRDIRDVLTDALGMEGYSVDAARHGAEALERLRERRPDIIILDLMMPVMDGPTFIAAKNSDPRIARIPVLAVTAALQTRVEGVTGFMRKPFALDSLLAAIARCLAAA